MAATMEERCNLLTERFGAKFYKDPALYDGLADVPPQWGTVPKIRWREDNHWSWEPEVWYKTGIQDRESIGIHDTLLITESVRLSISEVSSFI
jgi:hypothetical protein